jgi:putative membrane protein
MNYRLLTTTAAIAAALALAACGDKNTADEATSTAPGAELTEQGQLPEANADNTAADQASIDFIQKLALSDMYEVESSKIALTKSTSPSVKAYAQSMITAHTATSAALKPIADSMKVMPPVTLDNAHAEKIADLKKAAVNEFDQKFLDQQEEAHENALNALNDQAKNGSNAALVSFAVATAPKVAEHLAMVKKLDENGVDEPKK